MSKRAEEAALKAYPISKEYTLSQRLIINDMRDGFIQGYEQSEKDMKEWFIQFVHRHYPLNYVGWIKDFERAWEENNG